MAPGPSVAGRRVGGAGTGVVGFGLTGRWRRCHHRPTPSVSSSRWAGWWLPFPLVRPELVRLGRLLALAALWSGQLSAAVVGQTTAGGTGHAARLLATLLPAVLMAVGVQFLLSIPDGRLTSRARAGQAVAAYAGGVAFGLWAWFGPGRMSDPAAVVGWLVAVGSAWPGRPAVTVPPRGIDRQRLQLMAGGAVATVEFGLVVVGLSVLVKWPVHPGPSPPGAQCWCRSGVACATFPGLLGSRTGCWSRC